MKVPFFRPELSDDEIAEVVGTLRSGWLTTGPKTKRFEEALRYMLSRIAATDPDVVVAEADASPMEPYNGEIAIDALNKHVCFVVLCASDPYSVVGVQTAFGLRPDIITGPATNTTAGVHLAEKLTQLPALNLLDPNALPRLRELLKAALPETYGSSYLKHRFA